MRQTISKTGSIDPEWSLERESPQKRTARAEHRGGPGPDANGGLAIHLGFASRTASALGKTPQAQPVQQRERGF